MKILTKQAEQGDAEAQFLLGTTYYKKRNNDICLYYTELIITFA